MRQCYIIHIKKIIINKNEHTKDRKGIIFFLSLSLAFFFFCFFFFGVIEIYMKKSI